MGGTLGEYRRQQAFPSSLFSTGVAICRFSKTVLTTSHNARKGQFSRWRIEVWRVVGVQSLQMLKKRGFGPADADLRHVDIQCAWM